VHVYLAGDPFVAELVGLAEGDARAEAAAA
jgi:hypothetical protein